MDLLNNFFCGVFTIEDTQAIREPNEDSTNNTILGNINEDHSKVKTFLQTLSISKSTGPDNMHPRVLWELSDQLAEPLMYVFRTPLPTMDNPRFS